MSLAIHPTEHLTDLQWQEAGEAMMRRLGYTCNMYVMVKHTDEPQPHIHIIGSRIRMDNYRTPPNRLEKVRAAAIAADLEEQYGLRRAAYRGRRTGSKSRGYLALSARGVPDKFVIQAMLDVALSGDVDFPTFLARCARYGIGVRGNIGKSHVSGISFELGGKVWKGSALNYSWGTIQRTTGFDKDLELLRNAPGSFGIKPQDLPEATRAILARQLPRDAGNPLLGRLIATLRVAGSIGRRGQTPEEEQQVENEPRDREVGNRRLR